MVRELEMSCCAGLQRALSKGILRFGFFSLEFLFHSSMNFQQDQKLAELGATNLFKCGNAEQEQVKELHTKEDKKLANEHIRNWYN